MGLLVVVVVVIVVVVVYGMQVINQYMATVTGLSKSSLLKY